MFMLKSLHLENKNAPLNWSAFSKTFFSGGSLIPPRLTDLVKLAQECCYHSNLAVAAHGVIVLTNIAISCPEKG